MSDRKYKQRGYQDDDRDVVRRGRTGQRAAGAGQRPERAPARRPARGGSRPKARRIPTCRASARWRAAPAAARFVDAQIFSRSKCPKCAQDLRSCAQCVHFDPSARFECTQAIPARVSPKDVANDCTFFTPRTSWERETSSARASKPSEPSGAKKAFDDLFKF